MAQANFQPTWALIKKPVDYPDFPEVGKLEMIWNTNSKSIYHRYSPYTNSSEGLLQWGEQPFYYVYADEGNKGLPSLRKYESRLFPIGSAPIDIIRLSKFLVSGKGVEFLAKQFLLQTGNSYNETRIYNPASPIVAAGMGLTLGSARPQRFININGGLAGIAQSLLGNFGTTLFGDPKVNPPSGTAPEALTGGINQNTGGKGLIRAQDANRGYANIKKTWTITGHQNRSFKSVLKNLATSLFSNFIPASQENIEFRSDEGTYGLMLSGGNYYFSYNGSTIPLEFGQVWWGGGKIIRKDNVKVTKPYKLFVNYTSTGAKKQIVEYIDEGLSSNIKDVGSVGYTPIDNPDQENKPGQRYGDSVGINSLGFGNEYESSDIMYQYKYYTDDSQKFPTKDPKIKDNDAEINVSLKNLIFNLKKASENAYTIDIKQDNNVLRSGNDKYNYTRLFNSNHKNSNPINYPMGMLKRYRDNNIRMTDNTISSNIFEKSFKLPTNGTFDAINTLEVLDKTKKIKNTKLKGWVEWNPYKDDLISLFFYDLVNEKYIPFRAIINGIQESGNATWQEMVFIGRADRLYSYGGFTRNLTFNIKIVISSILELIPTWQRINYINTSYKPSNYTKSVYKKITDRFMVPPMFMLTLGDLYRDQPIIIQSIGLTIPSDAVWETLNEDNSGGENWNYLANIIQIKDSSILYGQLPREVDLSFTLFLLEKERPVAGGATFGHAPRNNDWSDWNTNAVSSTNRLNNMDKKLIVDVFNKNLK